MVLNLQKMVFYFKIFKIFSDALILTHAVELKGVIQELNDMERAVQLLYLNSISKK